MRLRNAAGFRVFLFFFFWSCNISWQPRLLCLPVCLAARELEWVGRGAWECGGVGGGCCGDRGTLGRRRRCDSSSDGLFLLFVPLIYLLHSSREEPNFPPPSSWPAPGPPPRCSSSTLSFYPTFLLSFFPTFSLVLSLFCSFFLSYFHSFFHSSFPSCFLSFCLSVFLSFFPPFLLFPLSFFLCFFLFLSYFLSFFHSSCPFFLFSVFISFSLSFFPSFYFFLSFLLPSFFIPSFFLTFFLSFSFFLSSFYSFFLSSFPTFVLPSSLSSSLSLFYLFCLLSSLWQGPQCSGGGVGGEVVGLMVRGRWLLAGPTLGIVSEAETIFSASLSGLPWKQSRYWSPPPNEPTQHSLLLDLYLLKSGAGEKRLFQHIPWHPSAYWLFCQGRVHLLECLGLEKY